MIQVFPHAWVDFLKGVHREGDNYKLALYLQSEEEPEQYSAEGEVTGAGYEAGGQGLTGYSVGLEAGEAVLRFRNPVWVGADIRARCGVLYNGRNKRTLARLDFGRVVGVEGGVYEVRLPEGGVLRLGVVDGRD